MIEFNDIVLPLGRSVFLRDYWLKSFVHLPGKAGRFTSLLTWTDLNAILEQHRLAPPRLKLFQDGQAVDPARYLTSAMFGVPRLDAGGLSVCLAQGASLILDDVQEMAPRVHDLMECFQDVLRVDAFTNLYAGWRSQKAFDLHWDAQEAFVLQLTGRKRWKVYKPTRLHPLNTDVEKPLQPVGEPFWDGVMTNGDVLYIPRGWWHVAYPLDEPSLHLTVSTAPPTGLDYTNWIISKLRYHAGTRASLVSTEQDQARVADQIREILTDLITERSVSDFLNEWEANIRPSSRICLPDAPYDQLTAVTEGSHVRLAALHRLSFTPSGESFEFIAAGRRWVVPSSLHLALAMLQNVRAIKVAKLTAGLSDTGSKSDLFKSLTVLAQAGVVVLEKA